MPRTVGTVETWWGEPKRVTCSATSARSHAFPEVTELPQSRAPSWFVRGKSTFVMLMRTSPSQPLPHLSCAEPPGVQGEVVEAEPDRFLSLRMSAGEGGSGVRLDVDIDWDEMAEILEDAYRVIAPKKLTAELDARER